MKVTRSVKDAVDGATNRHEASAEDFDSRKKRVDATVESLCSGSKGDLFKRLEQLHSDWVLLVNPVIDGVREMASQLSTTGNGLQVQDSDGAGQIR